MLRTTLPATPGSERSRRPMLPPAMVALQPPLGSTDPHSAAADAAAAPRQLDASPWRVPHTEALVQRVLSSLEAIARRNTKRYRAVASPSAAAFAALVAPEAAPFVGRFDPAVDGEPVTAFHSLAVPEAPLAAVAATLQRGLPRHLDPTTCLVAFALLRRFEAATKLPVTLHMMHRLYLAALLVALKCHTDRPVEPTRAFAALCSMPAAELSRMESLFLQGIAYRASITPLEVEALIDDVLLVPPADGRHHHHHRHQVAQRTPFADPFSIIGESDAGSMNVSSDTDCSYSDNTSSSSSSADHSPSRDSCRATRSSESMPTAAMLASNSNSNNSDAAAARCVDGPSSSDDDTQAPGTPTGASYPAASSPACVRRGSAIVHTHLPK